MKTLHSIQCNNEYSSSNELGRWALEIERFFCVRFLRLWNRSLISFLLTLYIIVIIVSVSTQNEDGEEFKQHVVV